MTRRALVVCAVPLAAFVLACGATPKTTTGQAGPQTPAAETAAETTAPAAPAGPVTAFADGTYEVGTGAGQVPPGKYKTTPTGSCYWERLKGLSGEFDDIIVNGNAKEGAPTIVTIAKTDVAFTTKRCGTWQKA